MRLLPRTRGIAIKPYIIRIALIAQSLIRSFHFELLVADMFTKAFRDVLDDMSRVQTASPSSMEGASEDSGVDLSADVSDDMNNNDKWGS